MLIALTLAIVIGFVIWLKRAENRLTAVALGLIIGGALGNALDRLRHGAVTDFLDFYVAAYHWPAFNFADTGIVSGVGLLLLARRSEERRAGQECVSTCRFRWSRYLSRITVN